MTVRQSMPAPDSVDRSPATLTSGGVALVAAGVLQTIGALRIVLPSAPEWVAPSWQVLGWLVGGLVLLAASILLAVGRRGEAGLVGTSLARRAALIASSCGPLVLVLVFVLSWTIGPAVWGLTTPTLVVAQLVVLVSTLVVAMTVLRRGAIAGGTRWAFVGLAVIDAVALVLALVPGAVVAFQDVVVLVRPLAVIAVGVLLVRQGRSIGSTVVEPEVLRAR